MYLRFQGKRARHATSASFAPALRVLVHQYDLIFDGVSLPDATRRKILASFLSLARDTDQPALWRWLCLDPTSDSFDAFDDEKRQNDKTKTEVSFFLRRQRRPPRLVSFMRLMCDALDAFAVGEGTTEVSTDDAAADGHRSTVATLVVLELLESGGLEIEAIQVAENDTLAKSRGTNPFHRRRSQITQMGVSMFTRSTFRSGGAEKEKEPKAGEDSEDLIATQKVSPSITFHEGSLGVLLSAMRFTQSTEAWRSLSPFIQNVLWSKRTSLLQSVLRDAGGKLVTGGDSRTVAVKNSSVTPDDRYGDDPFPPPIAPPPGVTPQTFLEKAASLLFLFV